MSLQNNFPAAATTNVKGTDATGDTGFPRNISSAAKAALILLALCRS
jgi:hypothetical protein